MFTENLCNPFPCQRGKVLYVPFQTSPSVLDQEDPPSCYKFSIKNSFWLLHLTGCKDIIFFLCTAFIYKRYFFRDCHIKPGILRASALEQLTDSFMRENTNRQCSGERWNASWIYWSRGTDPVPALCWQHQWWRMARGCSTRGWGHVPRAGVIGCSGTPGYIRPHHLEERKNREREFRSSAAWQPRDRKTQTAGTWADRGSKEMAPPPRVCWSPVGGDSHPSQWGCGVKPWWGWINECIP